VIGVSANCRPSRVRTRDCIVTPSPRKLVPYWYNKPFDYVEFETAT